MTGAIYNEDYSVLEQFIQQEETRRLFPNCSTRLERQTLLVDFKIKDPDYRTEYLLQVQYTSQSYHKVFVIKPRILPSVVTHMYPDSSLCLYYPPDISPFRRLWVGKDLIPMAALWVCHYEQWLINGNVWKGREAPGHAQLVQRLQIKN
jgi:hypothetical protein